MISLHSVSRGTRVLPRAVPFISFDGETTMMFFVVEDTRLLCRLEDGRGCGGGHTLRAKGP